jgi:hypothetical protein
MYLTSHWRPIYKPPSLHPDNIASNCVIPYSLYTMSIHILISLEWNPKIYADIKRENKNRQVWCATQRITTDLKDNHQSLSNYETVSNNQNIHNKK